MVRWQQVVGTHFYSLMLSELWMKNDEEDEGPNSDRGQNPIFRRARSESNLDAWYRSTTKWQLHTRKGHLVGTGAPTLSSFDFKYLKHPHHMTSASINPTHSN